MSHPSTLDSRAQNPSDLLDEARSSLKNFGKSVGPFINKNPYVVLGAAVVTGFVVSRILSKR